MQVAEGILDEVEKNYPVDLQRVYLTGLSMGGFGSWQLATASARSFRRARADLRRRR